MTNDERSPKDTMANALGRHHWAFVIRASTFFRHSSLLPPHECGSSFLVLVGGVVRLGGLGGDLIDRLIAIVRLGDRRGSRLHDRGGDRRTRDAVAVARDAAVMVSVPAAAVQAAAVALIFTVTAPGRVVATDDGGEQTEAGHRREHPFSHGFHTPEGKRENTPSVANRTGQPRWVKQRCYFRPGCLDILTRFWPPG